LREDSRAPQAVTATARPLNRWSLSARHAAQLEDVIVYAPSDLGFRPFFEKQLQSSDGREVIPARIAAEHRGAYELRQDERKRRQAERVSGQLYDEVTRLRRWKGGKQ